MNEPYGSQNSILSLRFWRMCHMFYGSLLHLISYTPLSRVFLYHMLRCRPMYCLQCTRTIGSSKDLPTPPKSTLTRKNPEFLKTRHEQIGTRDFLTCLINSLLRDTMSIRAVMCYAGRELSTQSAHTRGCEQDDNTLMGYFGIFFFGCSTEFNSVHEYEQARADIHTFGDTGDEIAACYKNCAGYFSVASVCDLKAKTPHVYVLTCLESYPHFCAVFCVKIFRMPLCSQVPQLSLGSAEGVPHHQRVPRDIDCLSILLFG